MNAPYSAAENMDRVLAFLPLFDREDAVFYEITVKNTDGTFRMDPYTYSG